ncbi:MAG: NAD(P)-dependent alcohol dehydrogenase [Alphaproteobacteria bacterium]|nr:NAD(P)-dependent alcohol dehydrogenase [Alphaproteobacteria bacterium]OJV11977.1 MAG: hydroxyacid dehydrogenase [Alphaproteobacteria bacterium 33-17]
MVKSKGYAAQNATSNLAPFEFERRPLTDNDILIEIMYCGVCHSDIHTARNEWKGTIYPVVPGHEIIGKVIEVGKNVTKFKVGDIAGSGCFVDSCRKCPECDEKLEQYCDKTSYTYNSYEQDGVTKTYGGYSNNIVVPESYAFTISHKDNLAAVAPLLCAGVTTYSPLKHFKVSKGQKVGVVGLGGLGHMGVKFAASFGAHVVVITTSSNKKDDALKLGAKEVLISKDASDIAKHAGTFDFILNTVSADHDINSYLSLLKRDGHMVIVGVPENPHQLYAGSLIFKRKSLSGSLIGGTKETQEMLDYCAKNNIVSDIEIIPINKINEAYDRMLKSDVKYRFVIDMKTL